MSEREMYRWRSMSDEQRAAVLQYRKEHCLPWHTPPHYSSETGLYLITAACYEHRHVIGHSTDRMAAFEEELLEIFRSQCTDIYAWTVLPNHYHILAKASDVRAALVGLGRLHGRTSFRWNTEEICRGRKVWFSAAETGIRSERHYWASLVYVLHNAVKHGYVTRWQDWPFCNAKTFLQRVGREEARRLWMEYPIREYGANWDPADI